MGKTAFDTDRRDWNKNKWQTRRGKKKNKINKRENSRVDDTHDSQTTANDDETTVMYKNVQTVLDEMVYFIYIYM